MTVDISRNINIFFTIDLIMATTRKFRNIQIYTGSYQKKNFILIENRFLKKIDKYISSENTLGVVDDKNESG